MMPLNYFLNVANVVIKETWVQVLYSETINIHYNIHYPVCSGLIDTVRVSSVQNVKTVLVRSACLLMSVSKRFLSFWYVSG